MQSAALPIQVRVTNDSEKILAQVMLQEAGLTSRIVNIYRPQSCLAHLYVASKISAEEAQQLVQQQKQLQAPLMVILKRAEESIIAQLVSGNVPLVYAGGWPGQRIKQLLKVAQERYRAQVKQRQQLLDSQKKIDQMGVINQAKGKLMQQQQVSEARAHAALQRLAMSRGISLAEIARQVLQS